MGKWYNPKEKKYVNYIRQGKNKRRGEKNKRYYPLIEQKTIGHKELYKFQSSEKTIKNGEKKNLFEKINIEECVINRIKYLKKTYHFLSDFTKTLYDISELEDFKTIILNYIEDENNKPIIINNESPLIKNREDIINYIYNVDILSKFDCHELAIRILDVYSNINNQNDSDTGISFDLDQENINEQQNFDNQIAIENQENMNIFEGSSSYPKYVGFSCLIIAAENFLDGEDLSKYSKIDISINKERLEKTRDKIINDTNYYLNYFSLTSWIKLYISMIYYMSKENINISINDIFFLYCLCEIISEIMIIKDKTIDCEGSVTILSVLQYIVNMKWINNLNFLQVIDDFIRNTEILLKSIDNMNLNFHILDYKYNINTKYRNDISKYCKDIN